MSQFSWKKTPSTAGILAASLDVQKVWDFFFQKAVASGGGVRNHGPEKTKRHLGEFFHRGFGGKKVFDDSGGGEANIFGGGKFLETCSPNPGSCRTVTAEAGI